jgi:hypothetical protein
MKTRITSNAYSYLVLMAIMATFLGLALAMEYTSAKMIPLIIGSLSFCIITAGAIKEIWAKPKPVITEETGLGEESAESWRQYLVVAVWGAGFYLIIFLFGFFIAIALFILLFMKFSGTRLWVAILFALLTLACVYGLFELGLQIELYRGLLFI